MFSIFSVCSYNAFNISFQKMGKHSRSLQKPATASAPPGRPPKSNVDLLMECVDEELAPSQKEANLKAASEYSKAQKQIETVYSQPKIAPVPIAKS